MPDDDRWEQLDHLIKESSSLIDIFSNVSPTQESLEAQKQQFLDGEIDEPSFTYDSLDFDPDELQERLEETAVPDSAVGTLYQKTIKELKDKADILKHRGDDDVVRDRVQEIYGKPDDDLVTYAKEILATTTPTDTKETEIEPDEARTVFDVALDKMGMDDWETTYTDKATLSVKTADKQVKVPADREYEQTEPIRLAIHELLHAARSANGYQQDHDIFGIGVAGYQDTDEGLAIFLEEQTGFEDEQTLRKYAARVLVTNNVMEGKSFRETFEMLHDEYDIDEDNAFQYTARGYRAGGFAKDHIYLQGYRKVKEYVEAGGSLDDLYTGKIPLESVESGQLDEIEGLEDPTYDHQALDKGLEPLFEDTQDEYQTETEEE
ncbi:MAG: flavohemoglobin expression-modulating QEGLA motif protein [Candidatus Nanohaloarchaeota archaeon QJJ-5]|nr:flavohemoglobin expression-modulating QEGLA motif protein [Candidatus Nanohaloarchaeota archaeon QJJ-5]